MSLRKEFSLQYSCDAPEYLPKHLAKRLVFLSCLRQSEKNSVFLVKAKESGEKQILKITGEGAPNNLSREYDLLLKLRHPGIPRAILLERDKMGREYLLRAYAEGDTLKSLLERDGVFSQRQTLEIAHKLCEVLRYLHDQEPPIIYRDITPDNVVVTPNGKLSLIDFGISREDTNEKGFDTVYVGSAAFASPEQFGFTKTDRRSDIFAIGKLMIYLATGDTGLQQYTEQIPPGGFKKIIAKCTRLSPEKRYGSVRQLSRAIARLLYPPTRREYLTAAACTLLVIAAGIAAGGYFLLPGPEPPPPAAPLGATGADYADEVKIPVQISVLYGGEPYADCAVAVDNHHWYQPAPDGRAELMVFAYDNYSIRAASGNRTAIQPSAVTPDMEDLSFAFDLALVPGAPEYLPLTLPFGTRQEVPLPVELADGITLSGEPLGVSVVRAGEGFTLVADGVEQPGHYTIFAEWSNEYGIADTVISLAVTEEREPVYIRTPQELERMHDDLAGYYVLANDIDLSGYGGWTPVGAGDHPFTGILDGNGFEIRGLAVSGYKASAGLFDYCDRALIKNVVIRGPDIQSRQVDGWGISALVGAMDKGMIENCSVVGGSITADTYYYSSVGGICGRNSGIIKDCFNAAEIAVTDIGRSESESMVGGICGENAGYIGGCVNTGAVSSPVFAGGIAGFCDRGIVTNCFNTGYVQAPVYMGEYPPGGIAHLLGRGKQISYCAFEAGTAPVGATVWNRGTLLSIQPLSQKEMQKRIESHRAEQSK